MDGAEDETEYSRSAGIGRWPERVRFHSVGDCPNSGRKRCGLSLKRVQYAQLDPISNNLLVYV